MAQYHVGGFVVGVCAAEAGGGDFDEDLVGCKRGFFGGGFCDFSGLGAFVDCEGGHGGGVWGVSVRVLGCY